MRDVFQLMLIGGACVMLVCGCASVEDEWRTASQINTLQAYEQFRLAHPDESECSYSFEARKRILQSIKTIRIRNITIHDRPKDISMAETRKPVVRDFLRKIVEAALTDAGFRVTGDGAQGVVDVEWEPTVTVGVLSYTTQDDKGEYVTSNAVSSRQQQLQILLQLSTAAGMEVSGTQVLIPDPQFRISAGTVGEDKAKVIRARLKEELPFRLE